MRITDKIKQHTTLSFEVYPPKSDKPLEPLLATLEKLYAFHPDFISCTYGALGTNKGRNLEVVESIQRRGVCEALSHYTCVGNRVCDVEQALSEYLASQGRLRSFLTLWFLAVVQVLSLVIPAMPVQLAAGLAYGPWMGFLTSFSASAVANMSVYLIARRLVPVIRRLVADTPKAAKLLDSVRSSKDPWFYTILAFITPGLPNGIIPYAAANAGMRPKQFLAAIFISLPFPTLLTCAAGSFMLEGNWLFTVLTGIVLFSFVGILFFNRTKFIAWAHEVKNRHTQKAGA